MNLEAATDDEYAAFEQPGRGSIAGQAFLTTRGGDVKMGAGRTVTLDPATRYARAWYQRYGRILARVIRASARTALRQGATHNNG
jgi:hypothetical protein